MCSPDHLEEPDPSGRLPRVGKSEFSIEARPLNTARSDAYGF